MWSCDCSQQVLEIELRRLALFERRFSQARNPRNRFKGFGDNHFRIARTLQMKAHKGRIFGQAAKSLDAKGLDAKGLDAKGLDAQTGRCNVPIWGTPAH